MIAVGDMSFTLASALALEQCGNAEGYDDIYESFCCSPLNLQTHRYRNAMNKNTTPLSP